MATIKEKAEEKYPQNKNVLMYSAYIDGANTALEIVETYIQNLDLGNNVKEKFYKLDVIADIGLFIEELKGE